MQQAIFRVGGLLYGIEGSSVKDLKDFNDTVPVTAQIIRPLSDKNYLGDRVTPISRQDFMALFNKPATKPVTKVVAPLTTGSADSAKKVKQDSAKTTPVDSGAEVKKESSMDFKA